MKTLKEIAGAVGSTAFKFLGVETEHPSPRIPRVDPPPLHMYGVHDDPNTLVVGKTEFRPVYPYSTDAGVNADIRSFMKTTPLPKVRVEDGAVVESSDPSLIGVVVKQFHMYLDRLFLIVADPASLSGERQIEVAYDTIETDRTVPVHMMQDLVEHNLGEKWTKLVDEPPFNFAPVGIPVPIVGDNGEQLYLDEWPVTADHDYYLTKGKVRTDHSIHHLIDTSFLQSRSTNWLKEAWPDKPITLETRATRFLEEAIELVQTQRITREKMHELVDFVMNKEVGDINKELGDANFCLLALAEALDRNLGVVTNNVINDAYDRIPQIREKSKLKPKVDHGSS